MEIKDFTQLEEFLFKKKQRFVDMFLWQLHLDGTVNKFTSVGLHDDIRNCIQSLNSKYSYSSDPDNTKGIIEYYIDKCNRSLIPDEHLNWLDKKNLRQCNFVWLLLKKEGVLNPSHLDSLRGNSDKHYVIIRALDLFPEKMPFKIKEINNTREAWQDTKKYAGWRYDWLDMHDESQCKKAVVFLTKKISEKSNSYSKPPLALDDNELNDYYKFLASVDIWPIFNIGKQDFYKKITDAARKWKTLKQKKTQVKLKSKAKENNHILLKDKKSLKILKSIQEKMEHKTPDETLKYIINEQAKRTDFVEIHEASANKDEVRAHNGKEDANKPSEVQLSEKQELNDDLAKPNK